MKNVVNQVINRFTYDFSDMGQLRPNVVGRSSENIKQITDKFETQFTNLLEQSIPKTVTNNDLSEQSELQLFTSVSDQQITQPATDKGFGLTNDANKQLNNQSNSPININNRQSQADNNQNNIRLAQSLFSDNQSNLSPEALGLRLYQQYRANNLVKPNELALQNSNSDLDKDHITQFVVEWFETAKKASKTSGIPYEVIIAQAALETGWGRNLIKTIDNQSSYNYFGIKATSSWKGNSTRSTTREFINDSMVKIQDEFRVYNSKQHALADYLNLLTKNPRYQEVINAPDARTAAKALQQARYSTDPNYSDKLIQIISRIEDITKKTPPKSISDFKHIAFQE